VSRGGKPFSRSFARVSPYTFHVSLRMFDIGFSELVIIAIVALIVIGPERLPKVARTLGHLLGRMQRYVNDVKADISREMEIDELRKLQNTIQDAAHSLEHSVSREISETEAEFKGIADSSDERIREMSTEPLPHASSAPADGLATPAGGQPSPQLELELESKAGTRRQA